MKANSAKQHRQISKTRRWGSHWISLSESLCNEDSHCSYESRPSSHAWRRWPSSRESSYSPSSTLSRLWHRVCVVARRGQHGGDAVRLLGGQPGNAAWQSDTIAYMLRRGRGRQAGRARSRRESGRWAWLIPRIIVVRS